MKRKEKFSIARLVFWLFVTFTVTAVWAAATLFGFIGNTAFIGHASMLALVLSAGAAVEASLPSVGDNKEEE